MKKVYISGPYTADTESDVWDNIMEAREEAKLWWKAGAAVFCPHMNSAFMGGLAPVEQFYSADLEFLTHCDIVVVLPLSQFSEGCKREIQLAREQEKLILWATYVPGEWEDSQKRTYTLRDIEVLCQGDGTST